MFRRDECGRRITGICSETFRSALAWPRITEQTRSSDPGERDSVGDASGSTLVAQQSKGEDQSGGGRVTALLFTLGGSRIPSLHAGGAATLPHVHMYFGQDHGRFGRAAHSWRTQVRWPERASPQPFCARQEFKSFH